MWKREVTLIILSREMNRGKGSHFYLTINVYCIEDPAAVGLLNGPPGTADSSKSSGGSLSKYDEVIPCYMSIVKSYFTFAYVWSFGGNLHDRYTF